MRRDTRLLLAGAWAAGTAANARRPVARSGPLSLLAFASGMPASELPVQTALLQAAVAGALARRGGLRGVRGGSGAALTVAAVAVLARVHRDAAGAGPVLEQALRDGLGPDYRDELTGDLLPAAEVPLRWPRILLPDLAARRRYRVARNIAYGPHGRQNYLDVWRRSDLPTSASAPVLVQLHGGGWSTGMKEGQGEPLMAHLAARGWVCVAPNYRLSPRANWPDHIVDVKRALAWVKENVAAHGGDPDFVVVTGGSAGAHLAAVAALTPRLRTWQPGFEDADTSVAAAVPLYGVYDFLNRHGSGRTDSDRFYEKRLFKSVAADDRTRWDQASPMGLVNADAPPFFVIHGSNDSLAPWEEARDFAADLRQVSHQPVVFARVPGAQHAFDTLPSVRAQFTVHAVERFLAVVRSRHRSART